MTSNHFFPRHKITTTVGISLKSSATVAVKQQKQPLSAFLCEYLVNHIIQHKTASAVDYQDESLTRSPEGVRVPPFNSPTHSVHPFRKDLDSFPHTQVSQSDELGRTRVEELPPRSTPGGPHLESALRHFSFSIRAARLTAHLPSLHPSSNYFVTIRPIKAPS